MSLGVGAFALMAAPGIVSRPRRRLHRRQVPMMGTVADVGVVDRDPERARRAIEAAVDALRRVETTMTRFEPVSDVGRANRLAAGEAVPVTRETAEVLRAALRWAGATDGDFDPCLAGASELWDVRHRDSPPPEDAVRRYAGRRLYRALDLGWSGGRPVVRFGDPDVGLDLGGIAKGYGVDRAAAALRSLGVRDGLVNVGGDLYALGTSPDGDPWRVGVRSASDPSRLTGEFPVTDGGVATSGDYEQFFEHGGSRYHHLLNPETGAPRRADRHSLTVVASTCMAADAAATAAFGRPEEVVRRRVALAGPHARVVSGQPGPRRE